MSCLPREYLERAMASLRGSQRQFFTGSCSARLTGGLFLRSATFGCSAGPRFWHCAAFREQHRFMRGLVAWLGLKEAILPFHRPPRAAGETKYTLFKMIHLAWTAVASFSALPLRLSIAAGVLLSLAGFGYFLYALYAAVVLGAVVPGWTSLVFLQCLFSGVTLLALGLIGDYVARIYEEIKNRPLYVVNEILNGGQVAPVAAGAVILTPRQAELLSDEVRRKISAKSNR